MSGEIKKRLIVAEDLLLDKTGEGIQEEMPTSTGGVFNGTPINSNNLPLIKTLRDLMNNAYSVGDAFNYILNKISSSVSDASTEQKGLVELATSAELLALTDRTKAITPQAMAQLQASESQLGLVTFATLEECAERSLNNKVVSPAGLASIQWEIGSVRLHYGESAPSSWLFMNGALVSRTTYAPLWEHVKDMAILDGDWTAGQYGKFSQGDGSTTFRLPDARGNFLRIWDNGRGLDPDASNREGGDTVGSVQEEEFKRHKHVTTMGVSAGDLTHDGEEMTSATLDKSVHVWGGTNQWDSGSAPWSLSSGGSETRPVNINLMLIIKAK